MAGRGLASTSNWDKNTFACKALWYVTTSQLFVLIHLYPLYSVGTYKRQGLRNMMVSQKFQSYSKPFASQSKALAYKSKEGLKQISSSSVERFTLSSSALMYVWHDIKKRKCLIYSPILGINSLSSFSWNCWRFYKLYWPSWYFKWCHLVRV